MSSKLGLALSGGGFRASFFHLGVLARMAELGLLRQVEVISTVSGGSIIGALYYCHLKRLLESTPDGTATGSGGLDDKAYIEVVRRVEAAFLEGVHKDFRNRTVLNVWKNLRMARSGYSRSDRFGELLDRYLYRPALGSGAPVRMRDLLITPLDAGGRREFGFHPSIDNAGRWAKVPVLLVNATTLNTGHNWRFSATRMGCPPHASAIRQDCDKNLHLASAHYTDLAGRLRDFPLGTAVAASACVPGLFHPLAISDLYAGALRVLLVDGGVHDNQGIQGLLDEGCDLFVVSDACGQLRDDAEPAARLAAVLGRTTEVLMDRVREEQLFRLQEEHPGRVALVHLRRGLANEVMPYRDMLGRAAALPAGMANAATSTLFGVHAEVQELLSRVRTDLDVFTDVESFSLMLDGFQMSGEEFRRAPELAILAAPRQPGGWDFQRVGRLLAEPTDDFRRHLQVAAERTCKVFRLDRRLAAAAGVLGSLALYALYGLVPAVGPDWPALPSIRPGVALLVAGNLLLAVWALATGRPGKGHSASVLAKYAKNLWFVSLVVPLALAAAAALQVYLLDPIFLRLGSIDRLDRALWDRPPGP